MRIAGTLTQCPGNTAFWAFVTSTITRLRASRLKSSRRICRGFLQETSR